MTKIVCERDEKGVCTCCGETDETCIIEKSLRYVRSIVNCPHCTKAIDNVLADFEQENMRKQ